MENELFMNTLSPPPPEMATHFETQSSLFAMMNWHSMSSSMETQPPEPNLSQNLTQDCFFREKSTEQSIFDSALSSLVSSPTASNFSGGGGGGDSFIIRELIGKLGNTGNSSGDVYRAPASNGSRYATPMSSPPPPHPPAKLSSTMMVAKTTPLAEFSGDPGFAERAARFSCFGSRSFNGRNTPPFAVNNDDAVKLSAATTVGVNGKLPRVSSSPALKALASQMFKNSPPGSEDQCPKASGEFSRKRKSVPKGKHKENTASPSPNSFKADEGNEDSDAKRSKKSEENGKKEEKREEEGKGNKTTNRTKPSEPPKDYIHVRARRGQATDSHSLAERVRREKISERMKLLQDLVPGCNKVTGKALMLDEIINYVQSLQRQVEFLSMKLASVNTRLDFNVDALVSKDMIPPSNNQQLLGHHHRYQQNNLQLHPNIPSISTMVQCPINPLDTSTLTRSFTSHIPTLLNQLTDSHDPQYSTVCEDDLHGLLQMGYTQNTVSQSEPVQTQSLQSPSQYFQSLDKASHMKIEL